MQSPETATVWRASKIGDPYKKAQTFLPTPVEKKHIFCGVKFRVGLFTLLTRKFKTKKDG
jgi:hypothetical protein